MLTRILTGLILCLSFAAASAAAPAPTAATTSVEDFFSYSKISDVEISPDGKYLALVVADPKTGDKEKGIVIMSAAGDHKVTASFRVTGYQIVYQIWWTLDDRILASTATEDTGFLDAPLRDGELFAINADGTKQVQLMPRTKSAQGGLTGGTASDKSETFFDGPLYMEGPDPKHVLVFGYTSGLNGGYHQVAQAYSLDTYTGDSRLVLISPLQDGGFITDNKQVIRLATGEDPHSGDRQLLYRATGDSHDWKDLSGPLKGDDPAAAENGAIAMTPDDKNLYWSGRTPTSTLGLYTLDTGNFKLQELYSDPDVDVDNLIWNFNWTWPRKIVAVETMPGLPAVHVLDGDDPKAQILASLYDAFQGQRVRITSNTQDGNLLVVAVFSDRNPGQYYLFDAKTGQASFLFSAKPEIDPDRQAPMQPITYQARDGVTIHGYLTLPLGSSGKNLPLIINPHGGPHEIRDYWGWDSEVQFFAAHGYAVLQVNYRGSGGYGKKFQDLGYGHWATTMQDDLADAVLWAEKQGTVDPKRVCIYGASYGGYAALENAERYPDLYKCAVGYVGLYDLKTMNDSDFSHYASGKHYTGAAVGRDDALLAAESPVNGADKIAAPVFIAYGGMDRRVVPKNAEEMMAAMDKAGKKYQKLEEPLEQHGFSKTEHRVELYTQMLAFIDANIGPGATGATSTGGK